MPFNCGEIYDTVCLTESWCLDLRPGGPGLTNSNYVILLHWQFTSLLARDRPVSGQWILLRPTWIEWSRNANMHVMPICVFAESLSYLWTWPMGIGHFLVGGISLCLHDWQISC